MVFCLIVRRFTIASEMPRPRPRQTPPVLAPADAPARAAPPRAQSRAGGAHSTPAAIR